LKLIPILSLFTSVPSIGYELGDADWCAGQHGVEPGRHGLHGRAVVRSSGAIELVWEGKREGALSARAGWVEVFGLGTQHYKNNAGQHECNNFD
jgi:hypothetical protein